MAGDDDQDDGFKVVFAPGCFDGFEGTQEELDALVQELTQKAKDGSLFRDSIAASDMADMSPDDFIAALQRLNPEVVEFVEGLSDEEVTQMLESMDVMAQYPEINHTLH